MDAEHIGERGTEWPAVLALLAREARTPMGRERALTARPLTDLAAVQAALDTTTQARRALAPAPLPLDDLPDVRPILAAASVAGAVLGGPDLVQLLPVLEAAPRLAAWGRGVRAESPAVAAVAEAAVAPGALRDRLRRALDDEGAVTDEASARLGRLRREIRDRRRRLVADLERLLHGPEAERLFTDRYVTLRHGRYVLPLRAEARGRLRGIVHDRSQSGQTVFVEPEAVVEANNDLVHAVREEEQEVQRVLAELTEAVRAEAPALAALVAVVGELDWVCARAAAAERMAAEPAVVDAGRTVALRAARHPLLLAQQWADPARPVVPVDLLLDADRPLLLITGPNAGGKTIALKTLALAVLMTQIGCHVPAAPGSRLPVVTGLHVIVGDEQSVAENLSTFSAFVAQVRRVLAEADRGSLVLLDELGAGTDPDEGAALAQAILETLAERGALVLATTHLEPLKAFASTDPRARNAAVEFDAATLAPTFRLCYDQPGQSYALTIAARLGLDPALIARAQAHRSQQAARLGELLARLDATARSEARARRESERREAEVAARLAAARLAEESARAEARRIVERAREDAGRLVADIRRAVSAEWEELRRADRSRRALERSRARLREAAARLAPAPPAAGEAAATLTPGMPVTAPHLGLRGELVEIAGATATVRAGALTVRVPVGALQAVQGAGAAAPRPVGAAGPAPPGGERHLAPELLLLGRTTDEAREAVEKYLDDAFLAGLPTVRLVHGKGTGALRKAVRDLLAAHPLVESFRDGEPAEGGTGATVATLRVG